MQYNIYDVHIYYNRSIQWTESQLDSTFITEQKGFHDFSHMLPLRRRQLDVLFYFFCDFSMYFLLFSKENLLINLSCF